MPKTVETYRTTKALRELVRRAAKVDRQAFVDAIVAAADRVEAGPAAGAVPADQGDDKVVAAALAGAAAFIVTLDHHLLKLGGLTGVLFLRPGNFLRELGTQH